MKVQCDVCEKAAATLLCCADEAALCAECDQQVHAANKLAGKHERVPFIGQHPSSCDICQEKLGRFFCVEDRALLCRECDVSIHTANKLVGKHKRFLVSGVQVGLDAMAPQSMAPPPHSPAALLVCTSSTANSVANTAAMEAMQQRIPNPQQAICPSPPPPLGLCKANWTDNIHVTAQTFMHNAPNLQATTWPSPLIPPITFLPPHPHQLASPTSTCLADCLVHLDELLNANTTTTTFLDTPPRMSIPNLGWEFPNNTLTWDMVNANTYLFEDSLAEVPSTPSASIEYQSSFKRKRPVDELIHSTFDHTLLVPNNIFPPFKESKISFFGGGNGR